jgi:hypothetical protein
MATIHIVDVKNVDDMNGVKRKDDPLLRPFVALNDGTVMSFKEWSEKGEPV